MIENFNLIKDLYKMKAKIAIYSGSIPTTVFIENLISALGKQHSIFLFGRKKETYPILGEGVQEYPIYHIQPIAQEMVGCD